MRFHTLAEWLAWQETLHPAKIELGLGRVRAVARRMGLLAPSFTVVTVGGTNGKGSSIAMLEAILYAAGYHVGAYSSPHLRRYNERVRKDLVEVNDQVLCEAFARVDQGRGTIRLTYFEFGTLAAMDIFWRSDIDVAVLEVGMGGRLDAVNVWDADACMISTVDMDHTAWLGPDRDSIGYEKAGIMRPGRPAVCGDPRPPPRLLEHASALGVPLYVQDRDFGARPENGHWRFWANDRESAAFLPPRLRGAYQLRNAAAVLMVLDVLAERLPVDNEALIQGLASATVPGRFQYLDARGLRVCDVAHNPQAARALAATLQEWPAGERTHAVVAMLADKDMLGTVEALTHVVNIWHVAGLGGERGASSHQLGKLLRRVSAAPLFQYPDVAAALEGAATGAADRDRIVVFGSFYTVAAALAQEGLWGDQLRLWNATN